jgi:hypothetical protein
VLLGNYSADSVSADSGKCADSCRRGGSTGCVKFDFFRLCGNPRFGREVFGLSQNGFGRGNPHAAGATANQNQHAEALAREQATQKHPFPTSDNVSYVRLCLDFRPGFCGFLFFAVPCGIPAAGDVSGLKKNRMRDAIQVASSGISQEFLKCLGLWEAIQLPPRILGNADRTALPLPTQFQTEAAVGEKLRIRTACLHLMFRNSCRIVTLYCKLPYQQSQPLSAE